MATGEPLTHLIERAKTGDRGAFDELTSVLRERLLALVRSRLGKALRGKLEAEDVVQDALLKAFESIHAFRGTDADSLWGWLASISEHLIWNASRKRSLQVTSLALDQPDPGVSPSRSLRREDRLTRLERAVSELKPDQREVIVLAKIEGLKTKEIAERLGRPEDSVRQLLSRGLRALREKFGDTESLHLPDRGFEMGASHETE